MKILNWQLLLLIIGNFRRWRRGGPCGFLLEFAFMNFHPNNFCASPFFEFGFIPTVVRPWFNHRDTIGVNDFAAGPQNQKQN